MRPTLLALLVVLLSPVAAAGPADSPATIRLATFNVSMFRDREGQLREDLGDTGNRQAQLAAAILQDARPDIVLLNEFDWDAQGESARLFRDHYLAVGQDGRQPLDYPYLYVPETNTGLPSGQDLDANGKVVSTPGSRDYGGDAFGFGQFPGQYGFVIMSRYPIDYEHIRTFRLLLWKDLPGASIPKDFYSPAALDVMRLSSKNHVDVPVQVGARAIHVLASHPTPPSFDGPEDRNGARNADEIRFWSLYLGKNDDWLSDDHGHRGGLGDASFVILGDLNSDPNDGDSRHAAIRELLANPRLQGTTTPTSEGGAEQSRLTGGRNAQHRGDPAQDTADFDDRFVGNLRIDYVLPSVDLPIVASGVFWPVKSDQEFSLVGTDPFPVSDHRLVWVDVRLTAPARDTVK